MLGLRKNFMKSRSIIGVLALICFAGAILCGVVHVIQRKHISQIVASNNLSSSSVQSEIDFGGYDYCDYMADYDQIYRIGSPAPKPPIDRMTMELLYPGNGWVQ
jgi:hypothetical protein